MRRCRVIPYRCLSTGFNAGMIEVVRDSMTVMKIQRESLTGGIQLNTRTLHKWIKENNRDKLVAAILTHCGNCTLNGMSSLCFQQLRPSHRQLHSLLCGILRGHICVGHR